MTSFRVFKQFNRDPLDLKRWRKRLDQDALEKLELRGLVHRVVRTLAGQPCIKFKEVLESFEVHACVRKRLVNKRIVDLCCGHGLTGLLFAIFNPEVEQVVLLDKRFSKSVSALDELLFREFPGLSERVLRQEKGLEDFNAHTEGTGYLAVHACGIRTDECIELACEEKSPIVLAPCCYTGTGKSEPYALKKSLGVPTATDIGRTYRLEERGYDVQWEQIASSITPMNRVIIAHPKGSSPALMGAS